MNKLYLLFALFLALTARLATAQDVNDKNKALFDQTVDKINFRTIEFVYDRKYPRKKFPVTQSDFKTRKTFDDFEGNGAFKKLFLNYNDVSEKFKKKFGNGRYDLATFEKALSDILINKDFEFFISSLNKDDKIQLIKSLQQINKKGIAQFVDASGKPRGLFATDSVINESADPISKPGQTQANTETATEDEAVTDTNQAVINTDATPEEVFQDKTPRRDWLTWLSLLLSIGALLLAASTKFKDLPGLRSFIANNYQKRGEGSPIAVVKSQSATETGTIDPAITKKLDNLTREVEGLYAQIDDLMFKNSVLEQKVSGSHPKPFEVPKTAYFEPETEPLSEPRSGKEIINPVAPVAPKPENKPAPTETRTGAENIFNAEPKEEPAFKSFSVEDHASEKNEFTDETNEQPEVTFFLAKPDKQGFFWNEEMRRTFMPHQSFYEITLSENDPRKATFRFVEDKAQQKLAIENPEMYLYPVCDASGEGQTLQTEDPGKLVLNADQWVLVKKATVRLV